MHSSSVAAVYRTEAVWSRAIRDCDRSRMLVHHIPSGLLRKCPACPPGTDRDDNGICDILDLSPAAKRRLREALHTPRPLHPDTDRDGLHDFRDLDDDNDHVPDVRDRAPRESAIDSRAPRRTPPADLRSANRRDDATWQMRLVEAVYRVDELGDIEPALNWLV
jgi:hypothetical protein